MSKLSEKEVASLVRRVEREERVRFPVRPKVRFGRKGDPNDYAHWEAPIDARGRVTRIDVFVAVDEPKPFQETMLLHELREAAQQFKGKSPTKAHAHALKKEKSDLLRWFRRDSKKYGDSRGTPFVKALLFRKKLMGSRASQASSSAARGKRSTQSSLWQRFVRAWRWL